MYSPVYYLYLITAYNVQQNKKCLFQIYLNSKLIFSWKN